MNSPTNPTLPRTQELRSAKNLVRAALQDLLSSNFSKACKQWLAPDCAWHTCYPINLLTGPEDIAQNFYATLLLAFPDAERRTDIFSAGHWHGQIDGGEGIWISCTGHYIGTFRADWMGIPATGEPAMLRFGEFYRVVNGYIAESRILLDIVDLARQAGRSILPPSTGLSLLVPGPATHDGLLYEATDPASGEHSMGLVMAMIGGLKRFDQTDLESMGMQQYWHANMMWYGPCGIGSSRGVGGFQKHHQAPFLHAFPDRVGGHHRVRVAEGAYVATTGWPSVRATHAGDYLGVPATNRPITMRVMDWWRCEGDLLIENWVFIDLPHLMLQMDVDLLARLKN